jgi:hypothetical protein
MTEYVWYDFEDDEIVINCVGPGGCRIFDVDILDWAICLGEL